VCGFVGSFLFFSLAALLCFGGERAEEEMLIVTLIIISDSLLLSQSAMYLCPIPSLYNQILCLNILNRGESYKKRMKNVRHAQSRLITLKLLLGFKSTPLAPQKLGSCPSNNPSTTLPSLFLLPHRSPSPGPPYAVVGMGTASLPLLVISKLPAATPP